MRLDRSSFLFVHQKKNPLLWVDAEQPQAEGGGARKTRIYLLLNHALILTDIWRYCERRDVPYQPSMLKSPKKCFHPFNPFSDRNVM